MSDPRDRPRVEGEEPVLPPASSLRRRADEIARLPVSKGSMAPDRLSPEEAQRIIHELRIHQIELELQNEELRRTQEGLELARSRYFDLYDLAPVSYFTLSEEGLILEVNLTGAQLLDVARAALVRRPLNLFILPEDQDTFYLACRQLVNTDREQAFELRMTKLDGRPFWAWIEASAAHDDDGSSVMRMVITDITSRKLSEQALRTAEAMRESWNYYRQILESLPELVWTSAPDGSWDYLGPQWLKYTGFPEQEQLGLGWARQVHPDDRSAAILAWHNAVATGTMLNAEFRIRRYDGSFRRFRWRAVPLRDEGAATSKWFGTNTDIDPAE